MTTRINHKTGFILLGALSLCAPQLHAQPAAPAKTASSILSIPLPPNVKFRFDLDARDEDVLGVVKSFTRGFKGKSLKETLRQFASRDAKANAANSTGQNAPADVEKLAALQLLSDADLETLLNNVKHLRVVAFETPWRWGQKRSAKQQQAIVSYYENAYIAREGGRRIMRADFDDVQMLSVGFPNGGFGVIMQVDGGGVVLRADGYPDLEGAGPLVMGIMMRFSALIR